MSKELISKIIGPLRQDDNFQDWWKSQPFKIPFFDNEMLSITFMGLESENDTTFIDQADMALTNFFRLTAAERISISEIAYKNCMDFLDAVGFDEVHDPLMQIKDQREIWKFIHPTDIYVERRPYKEHDIYVMIACECDWEREHGLQLVFRQGKKLTRISEQDGHLTEADAFDKPDEEDELLSKF